MSCTTDVLKIADDSGTDGWVVLRRYGDLRNNRKDGVVDREQTALRIVSGGDVPAPRPLWVDEDHIFDDPAVVTTYVEGKPLGPSGGPADWPIQLAAAISNVHACPIREPDKTFLNDLSLLADKWITETEPGPRFTDHPLGTAIWERRQALLGSYDKRPIRFLHADFWYGNTLWRDNRLVAVIDWEDAGFGDPLVDVAGCATDLRLSGFNAEADQFVEEYAKLSSDPMDSYDLMAVQMLASQLPDVARILPSFHTNGWPDMTADELRTRFDHLVREVLATTG